MFGSNTRNGQAAAVIALQGNIVSYTVKPTLDMLHEAKREMQHRLYIMSAMQKLHSFDNVETVSVTVTGRVQGVGFRAATVRQAHLLKLTGWVRNNHDGSVEALLQGPHDVIDQMLSWLLMGPPPARVDQIDTNEVVTERRFDRFEQI